MQITEYKYQYPRDISFFLDKDQYSVFSKLLYNEKIDKFDLNSTRSLASLVSILQKKINPFENNENLTYKDILVRILKRNNIPFSYSISEKEMEELFLKNKFKAIVDNLTPEQRLKLDKQIRLVAEKEGLSSEQLNSINTVSLLTVANLSGFGMYIMASTVVGGISGVLGITLPFTFYMGMSSFLSFITGPIGWVFGLGYLAYTFRNDNIESVVEKISNQFFALKKQYTGDYDYVETVVIFITSNRLLLSKKIVEFEEDRLVVGYCRDTEHSINISQVLKGGKIIKEPKTIERINFEMKWGECLYFFRGNYIDVLCSNEDLIKIRKIQENRAKNFQTELSKIDKVKLREIMQEKLYRKK